MRRICWGVVLAGCWLLAGGVQAQSPSSQAALLAERDYAEERFRQLKDLAERLASAQAVLESKVAALQNDCRRLQSEMARRPANYLGREDLRPLEKRIQELGAKYEADKREIIGRLERLAKAAPKIPEESKTATKPPVKGAKSGKSKSPKKSPAS
jgi:hypothetical protein